MGYTQLRAFLKRREVGILYQYVHVGLGEDNMSSIYVVIHVIEDEDVFLRTESDIRYFTTPILIFF